MSTEAIEQATSGAARSLRKAAAVLDGILAEEIPAIRAAAELCASAIAGGGLIHVLGTGHSHILAEERFYRAGGLAAVNPIFDDRLMLHVSAIESTRLERLEASGEAVPVLASSNVSGGDEHNEAVLAPFRTRVGAL